MLLGEVRATMTRENETINSFRSERTQRDLFACVQMRIEDTVHGLCSELKLLLELDKICSEAGESDGAVQC